MQQLQTNFIRKIKKKKKNQPFEQVVDCKYKLTSELEFTQLIFINTFGIKAMRSVLGIDCYSTMKMIQSELLSLISQSNYFS